MMKSAIILLFTTFLIVHCNTAGAELMAIWDFGASSAYYTEAPTTDIVSGVPTLVLLGGEKDINGKNGVAYVDAAGIHHDAGQGAAWDDVRVTGLDAEWTLTINTTGFKDIAIRWDYRSEETPSFDFDYRVGGAGDWTVILNNQPITGDDAWHSFSCDLSAISDIDDQMLVEFRAYDFDRAGNGRFVFDNLELTGVPEPATVLLVGLGGLSLLRKRRAVAREMN